MQSRKICENQWDAYTPFGELWIEEASSVEISQITRLFTNQMYDKESGLYYMNARFYDPDIGTFITADPAMQGLNHYSYCSANPITYTDPTGLWDYRPSGTSPPDDSDDSEEDDSNNNNNNSNSDDSSGSSSSSSSSSTIKQQAEQKYQDWLDKWVTSKSEIAKEYWKTYWDNVWNPKSKSPNIVPNDLKFGYDASKPWGFRFASNSKRNPAMIVYPDINHNGLLEFRNLKGGGQGDLVFEMEKLDNGFFKNRVISENYKNFLKINDVKTIFDYNNDGLIDRVMFNSFQKDFPSLGDKKFNDEINIVNGGVATYTNITTYDTRKFYNGIPQQQSWNLLEVLGGDTLKMFSY